MIDDIRKDADTRMAKSLEVLKQEFSKVRTGRAHVSLLDHITVSYYGTETPLQQTANVNVEDSRTLTVTPWEKDLVPVIEKAIIASDLGLNPSTAGTVIRIPLPLLTEERRKDLVRVVRQEAENCRIAIRNIRRDANSETKEAMKEKLIGEDEEHHGEELIQKLTNTYIERVDQLLHEKEADLLSV